uniref:Metalloprotease family M48X putative n=1 Tax=Albugo laibachii Nc14 TaxID=890382 RepID=F0W0F0_9STRA|nr:metalloprotease family M48X putative [Albugo laibachii Nc14]|eukprot:CCA14522.1 metalloprotease family M48X putative [Albugo laibachii Nc14]
MSGYAAYTIAEPTNVFMLRQANAETSVLLQNSDPFVQYASKIASQVGIRFAGSLEFRLSEQNAGTSLGINLTKACIIVPLELYTAYHSNESDRSNADLPSLAEIDFVIAHECAHIADNHMIISRAAFPISLFGAYSLISKISNKWLAAIAGCATLLLTNVCVSRQIEYRADAIVAKAGFGPGGVQFFKRSQVRNCEVRELTKSPMITESGDYLGTQCILC